MSPDMTASMEDYLESIYILNERKKHVRVKDMARQMNVKPPSVIEALKSLEKKKFVIHEPYGYIELTEEGLKMAKRIYKRHKNLKNFLSCVLCLDERTAESDACRIEHHLSKETLERVMGFMAFMDENQGKNKNAAMFRDFNVYFKSFGNR
ncbi:MAG: metal-dependent transcriptional regulator [Candidatus Aureabacteria bacterium]|nr:metal-dependent transcriptional regulator [Candidatus Auribacterota bacterium]